MKKIFAMAAAAAALTMAFAAPASAVPFRGVDNINARQAQIEQRIEFGQRSGRLTFAEARQLQSQMRNINFLEARYRQGGLNFNERADLDRRLDRVSFDLQAQLADNDHGRGHRRF